METKIGIASGGGLAKAAVLGLAALAAVAGTGWWWLRARPEAVQRRASSAAAAASLGAGHYDLHYDFAMDVPATNKPVDVRLETALDGQLELTGPRDQWVAARVSGISLKLDQATKQLSDFPATGAEQELAEPWLFRVNPDGRITEVRFQPGTSNASRSVLMAIATGAEYVRSGQPDATRWSAMESDANGSYETHYELSPDGTVAKQWTMSRDVHSTSAAHFTLTGTQVASVTFVQQGDAAASGHDQKRRSRFTQHVRLTRTGPAVEGWASGLEPKAYQPFTAAKAHVKPPAEPPARPLRDLLPLVQALPEHPKVSDHAPIRDELTRALRQPGAPARVAGLLREGKQPPEARLTLMEALIGAQTPEAQHELAGLLAADAMPRAQQDQLLAGTTFLHTPNSELVHALSSLAFGKKTDPGYAAAVATALGGLVSRTPDQAVASSTNASLVAGAAVATSLANPQPSAIRAAWLAALGNTASPTALPTILASLANDPNELVRATAARALRYQDPKSSLQAMDRALLEDRSIQVRYEIMHAARIMGPQAMQPLVQRTLTVDKSESVRLAAAHAVAVWMVTAPGLKSVLQSALATEKSIKVRDSLMNYLNPGRVVPPAIGSPVTLAP